MTQSVRQYEDPLHTNHTYTYSVIQLDDQVDQVLLVDYHMATTGNSTVSCSVEKMRFNINMPFVKGMLTFLQQSFETWKPQDPPPVRPPMRQRGAARRRKINTVAINRKLPALFDA